MSVWSGMCAAVRRLLGRSTIDTGCRFRASTAAEKAEMAARGTGLMPPTLVDPTVLPTTEQSQIRPHDAAQAHRPKSLQQTYLFAARLASVRKLNKPKSWRSEAAQQASAVKTVAPRRVVWIAERPMMTARRSAQIIPFPARALPRRRSAQAA